MGHSGASSHSYLGGPSQVHWRAILQKVLSPGGPFFSTNLVGHSGASNHSYLGGPSQVHLWVTQQEVGVFLRVLGPNHCSQGIIPPTVEHLSSALMPAPRHLGGGNIYFVYLSILYNMQDCSIKLMFILNNTEINDTENYNP